MKQIVIILTLLTVSLSFAFAQTEIDSISMKKAFGGYQFYQGEKRLNVKQLVNTMKPNEQAYSQMKTAQSSYTIASIVGFAGGLW